MRLGRIEELAAAYERQIALPWQREQSGAQRVMLVVYEKELERALRARIGEFEQATRRSSPGRGWRLVDCTRWFAQWMADDEYREEYFADPDLLEMKLRGEFRDEVAARLRQELEGSDEGTVVGVIGVGSLYGFVRVSEVVRSVEPSIPGRLVVFFPGTKDQNNYRLLDARDGWNYLAQAVTLHGAGGMS